MSEGKLNLLNKIHKLRKRVEELEKKNNELISLSLDEHYKSLRYKQALEEIERVTIYEDEANEIASNALKGESE